MSYHDDPLSSADRMRMLGDSGSPYYALVSSILLERGAMLQAAEQERYEVNIPFSLAPVDRVRLERIFGWRIKVKDYGAHSRMLPSLAALSYLMEMRNNMMMGSDGDECIYIDGDVSSLVAKGMSYGHVCRTHATARLEVEYDSQRRQLVQMTERLKGATAVLARSTLTAMAEGSSELVCENATVCRRMADTVFFNHVSTPVSLAQAVATAKAHRASVVRGVCLFQPEMLVETEGELIPFDGSYVVDRVNDVISFIPRADPTMGFSHPYSSLMSFFTTNEYVDSEASWLVEKHMSGDGIFHYLVRKQAMLADFPGCLSTNLYTEDMTRFIYLSYDSYYDDNSGVLRRDPVRVKVPLLHAVYQKVMPALMSLDPKRLVPDEVLAMLKNYNNMVFCSGDVVKKGERIWHRHLKRAVVPLLAMAIVRRSETSLAVRAMLDASKVRFGLANASTWALLWAGFSTAVGKFSRLSFITMDMNDLAVAMGAKKAASELDVIVERGVEYVTVSHSAGNVVADYGRLEGWLPGAVKKRFDVLARARDFVYNRGVSVSSKSTAPSVATCDVQEIDRAEMDRVPVAVTELEQEVEPGVVELTGLNKQLFEKLVAQHDALSVVKPPRLVNTFEGPTRLDVDTVDFMDVDPLVNGQEDYDQAFPGVSEQDAEEKQLMAVSEDISKNIEFHGDINDSKRLLPRPRRIRRCKWRSGAAGKVPATQTALLAAVFKRNSGVPQNRGFVDLDKIADKVVDKLITTCFVQDWQNRLGIELENGLWQVTEADLAEYVPKVETAKAKAMLQEVFDASDENLTRWILMLKSQAKPPLDVGADSKVQQAQTILYSEQKSVNAKYSSMQTRFFHAFSSMLRPNVSFNNRHSPVEHEVWFNSCQGLRSSVDHVYGYEGDIKCYDRSQEHVLQVVEMTLYKRMGLNSETLEKWSETHGLKKAVSMMYGLVVHIFGQGLSGIWKTLFRNGLACLAAVVYSFDLRSEDLVTLDVVGDDFTIESTRVLSVDCAMNHFSLTFNLTAKLYGTNVLYMCGRYWVFFDGWWYYVADPFKKFESIARAISISDLSDDKSHNRWLAVRDDLRHYDNVFVMENLAESVMIRMNLKFKPFGLIRSLGAIAAYEDRYDGLYGPEEYIGA